LFFGCPVGVWSFWFDTTFPYKVGKEGVPEGWAPLSHSLPSKTNSLVIVRPPRELTQFALFYLTVLVHMPRLLDELRRRFVYNYFFSPRIHLAELVFFVNVVRIWRGWGEFFSGGMGTGALGGSQIAVNLIHPSRLFCRLPPLKCLRRWFAPGSTPTSFSHPFARRISLFPPVSLRNWPTAPPPSVLRLLFPVSPPLRNAR